MLEPVTAAELLRCEFLEPLGIGPAELAAATGLPLAELEAILQGRRAIDAAVDRRLCEHFELSQGYWLRAQALAQDDRRRARQLLAARLDSAGVVALIIGCAWVAVDPQGSFSSRQRSQGLQGLQATAYVLCGSLAVAMGRRRGRGCGPGA